MKARKCKFVCIRLALLSGLIWTLFKLGSIWKAHNLTRDRTNVNDNVTSLRGSPEDCETIHIAVVSAGANSNRDLVTLIKSLLAHRRNRLHVHLLVDKFSKKIFETLFRTWNIPHFVISFYNVEYYEKDISWIPNTHYSGKFGLVKLLVPSILPKYVDNVILLDTDIVFTADIAELWSAFKQFNRHQAIGLVENHSDWYLGNLYRNYTHWPALGRGFNTGVLLLAVKKLNKLKWNQIWRTNAEANLKILGNVALADQDIFNSVIKDDPPLVYKLPCFWNLQLSDNMKPELCYKSNKHWIKAYHWNVIKNLSASKRTRMFYHLRKRVVETNGAYFRNALVLCQDYDSSDAYTKDLESDNDCDEFLLNSANLHRTHLYYMPFDYKPVPNDVSIIVHLSIDRLQMLEILSRQWDGPISAAVFLTDSSVRKFELFVEASSSLNERKNIAFHLVFQSSVEDVYPINLLRNIALQQAVTDFVFLYDVDFVPMPGLYSYILSYLPPTASTHQTAYVVPAFESLLYKNEMATTKSELLQQMADGSITTFREKIWPQGHAPTNYTLWRTAGEPYPIKWQKDFEPYVVLSRKQCPLYDKRFVGFGWNKISHIMELDAIGFSFLVLPHGFITHIPHLPSMELQKYRTLPKYRECMNSLKLAFIENLMQKYNINVERYKDFMEKY